MQRTRADTYRGGVTDHLRRERLTPRRHVGGRPLAGMVPAGPSRYPLRWQRGRRIVLAPMTPDGRSSRGVARSHRRQRFRHGQDAHTALAAATASSSSRSNNSERPRQAAPGRVGAWASWSSSSATDTCYMVTPGAEDRAQQTGLSWYWLGILLRSAIYSV
jgi:hypothetical protein